MINRRKMLQHSLLGASALAWTPVNLANAGQSLFHARDSLPDAPPGSFSVIVVPDTQDYRPKANASGAKTLSNPVFDAHTDWIVNNLESQRIVMVSHVGDVVERNIDAEWTLARSLMDRLHGVVPYGISVGNHDMTKTGDSALFQKYFPSHRFEEFPWYGGCFKNSPDRPHVSGNNANSFQLLSAEGHDLIFVHLECNAPDDVLNWANNVLRKHADRTAMVTTHMSLGPIQRPKQPEGYFDDPQGRMRWSKIHGQRGNTPQQMWEKCFCNHPNLMMICSGDQRRSTAKYIAQPAKNGNIIHDLLSDYSPLRPPHLIAFRKSKLASQSTDEPARTDPLRIYRFVPKESRVDVITYDTSRQKRVDETITVRKRSDHQFSFEHGFAVSRSQNNH